MELCVKQELKPEELGTKWELFTINEKKDVNPTEKTISEFSKKYQSLSKQKIVNVSPFKKGRLLNKSNTPSTVSLENSKRKRVESKENSEQVNKEAISPDKKLVKTTSSSSISKPAPDHLPQLENMYNKRERSGQVLHKFGGNLAAKDLREEDILRGRVQVEVSASRQWKYLYDTVNKRGFAQGNRLKEISDQILQRYSLESPGSASLHSLEEVVVVGRIVSEEEGLEERGMMLETYATSQMNVGDVMTRVPLDFTSFRGDAQKYFGLHFGKIVALKGTNPKAKTFYVTQVYDDVSLPVMPREDFIDASSLQSVRVLCAAGPYTFHSGPLESVFKPLEDLMAHIERLKPHLVVLSGPFVDVRQPSLSECQTATFEEILESKFASKLESHSKKVNYKLLFQPSVYDALCVPTHPQPPLEKKSSWKTKAISNPSLLTLNKQLLLGVCSTDVLAELHSGFVESVHVPKGTEKMERICSSFFSQQSFFPIESPRLHFDSSLSSHLHFKEHSPDILVLPSEKVPPFTCKVKDSLVVNPGHVISSDASSSPGHFALLTVRSHQASPNIQERTTVEIINI